MNIPKTMWANISPLWDDKTNTSSVFVGNMKLDAHQRLTFISNATSLNLMNIFCRNLDISGPDGLIDFDKNKN